MIDTRIILRLAYDGNYERAIMLLVNLIENQQKEIEKLKSPEFITKKCVQLLQEEIIKNSEEQC